jgi:hypothetical protein
MRVRALVLTAALLWSASVFSEATVVSFVGGNELLQACSDDHNDGAQGYCNGYAVGVADALMLVNALQANGRAIPSACIPLGQHVKAEQIRDVVVQYLTAYPQIRHEAAAGRAWVALQAAFPCK